jgi:DNA repair photolyase
MFHFKKGYEYPSTHDITPKHLTEHIQVIRNIVSSNNKVLIVTKPHISCIQRICEEFQNFKEQILFRFTIGSTDSEILKFWETQAPSFEERFEALKYAYNLGFKTSISCEPMLDDNTGFLIETVKDYVTDTIWVGKANKLKDRLKRNGYTDAETLERAEDLIGMQSDLKIKELYLKYKDFEMVEWKDSVKKVVGLKATVVKGADK